MSAVIEAPIEMVEAVAICICRRGPTNGCRI